MQKIYIYTCTVYRILHFAREKLNLTYPEEEFITFKEDEIEEDERK